MKDCVLYIVLRSVVFLLRFLPLKAWLFLAKGCGWLYYHAAGRQNRKAYLHLKLAFGQKTRRELKTIIRGMHQRLAQNLVETLYLPYLGEAHFKKHVRIPDMATVEEALGEKRGIIFLGCHAGSWELSNAACAVLSSAAGRGRGHYAMLAQPQTRYKRLDSFLNRLRESKGCCVIRADELKKIVEHLSGHNILGTVADHGGQEGVPVEFFSKSAMTPGGSIRLAKKLNAKIILAFMHRLKGATHEMFFKPYELVLTGDDAADLRVNLTNINKVFESWIARYPQEYLWTYRRWKHSPQRNILVLSDGKAGHLKQSLALVEIAKGLGFQVRSEIIAVKFKTDLLKKFLSFVGFLSGPRAALACLRLCLERESARRLLGVSCDLVISAGSSLSVVNLAVASDNEARSVAVMKPGMFSVDSFDLVLMPRHDRPPRRPGVLPILGSLNNVCAESIKSDFEKLAGVRGDLKECEAPTKPGIGLLIGGDSKAHKLAPEAVTFLCGELKKALEALDGQLFVTTSRRSSRQIEEVLRDSFGGDPRCKLFVVANEHNPPGTVGAIFYLSDVVIVSGESISMVSEAVACGKYVIVFEPRRSGRQTKTQRFLDFLVQGGYIHLLRLNEVHDCLLTIVRTRPARPLLKTNLEISERLKELLSHEHPAGRTAAERRRR